MSVMVPRDGSVRAEHAPGRPERPIIDKWALCREFVERIVSGAQAAAARDHPDHPVPDVDWEQIWRAGDGAPSDEWAIGRIVRAASIAAQGIALRTPEPLSSPAEAGGVGPEAAVLTRQPPAGIDPVAPAAQPVAPPTEQPVTAPAEPVTAPTEPVATPTEPVTGMVEPVAPAAEPLTVPVEQATSVVEPVTVDRPDPAVAPVIDPAKRQELLIAPPVLVEEHVDEAHDEGTATGRTTRSHYGWATVFTWIRNLGVVILLFVVWQLWGTAISQAHAQSQLKGAFEASLRAHHPPKATGSGPALIPATAEVPSPAEGSVVAELQVPAIGLDQYVVSGTSATDLSKGPGHYIGSAMPGQAGNVAIAGHRTTHGAPFNRIGQLVPATQGRPGDRIILTTLSGEHLTYVVSATPVAVSPSDVNVLNYFGDNRITLTTCTPEFSAAQRLIVVAELQQRVATPKVPARHISYHIVDSATASWDWSLLPVVGIEVCLLLLLGLSYRRIAVWFGPTGKWFILVPVWAAGLYLLFDTLTTFLPSTI